MIKVELNELPDMRERAIMLEEIHVKESPLSPRALSFNGEETPEQPAVSKLLKAANSALEKKLEKKLLHEDTKLHELKYRCAHLLKVEKRCNDLQNELNVKKERVDVLTKGQVYMQQQASDSERKHTEDLTLLVSALEESKVDLDAQAHLIEILVGDLQKMKSTLENCKDELLRRDNRVSVLEEDLKKAKQNSNQRAKFGTSSKIHRAQAAGLQTSKRKYMRPHWQPILTGKLNPEGNNNVESVCQFRHQTKPNRKSLRQVHHVQLMGLSSIVWTHGKKKEMSCRQRFRSSHGKERCGSLRK